MERTLVAASLAIAGIALVGLLAPPAQAAEGPSASRPAPAVPAAPRSVFYRQVAELPPDPCPCPSLGIPDALITIPCFDPKLALRPTCPGDSFVVGAQGWHWWNVQNRGDHEVTYGYPGAEGTYYYAAIADVTWQVEAGKSIGMHAEGRVRDETKYAPYYRDKVWLYEGYAWMDAGFGKVKVGSVLKRFGVGGDGTFWGNVPFYDGITCDPDYGVSWERTWQPGGVSRLDTSAQFFLEDDGMNSSIDGADAESVKTLREKNTFVARVVPTWDLGRNVSLAVGLSGLAGSVRAESGAVDDETIVEGAVDATISWCGLKAFGEYTIGDGVQTPAHYVTGGPTDGFRLVATGVEWKLGAITPRVAWSRGEYDGSSGSPSGSQWLFDAGVQVELTKFLTLYLEYVRWESTSAGVTTIVEDGFQIVLNWHF